MKNIVFAALVVSGLVAVPNPAGASGEIADDCAYRLVATGERRGITTAQPALIGCFMTYEAAIEAGLGGSVDIAAGTTVEQLTDAVLATGSGDELIGTEWNQTGYGGGSKSYFASSTCSASNSWEVDYVTDTWNDLFSSGRGFGGCDRNRKFEDSNFGGASLLCTPNCTNYGSLSNQVSSLRWRAD